MSGLPEPLPSIGEAWRHVRGARLNATFVILRFAAVETLELEQDLTSRVAPRTSIGIGRQSRIRVQRTIWLYVLRAAVDAGLDRARLFPDRGRQSPLPIPLTGRRADAP
jgi:hypothetical protein